MNKVTKIEINGNKLIIEIELDGGLPNGIRSVTDDFIADVFDIYQMPTVLPALSPILPVSLPKEEVEE